MQYSKWTGDLGVICDLHYVHIVGIAKNESLKGVDRIMILRGKSITLELGEIRTVACVDTTVPPAGNLVYDNWFIITGDCQIYFYCLLP